MNVATIGCRDPRDDHGVLHASGVALIDDLCARPGRLADLEGVERLVMVLHRGAFELSQVQKHIRMLGLDPLGVQVLLVEDVDGDGERLAVMLAGATARATAFVGSTPAQSKPVFPAQLSRRALLGVPRPWYVAVPELDTVRCVAADGCRACVAECPEDAYTWVGGGIVYDKEACVSCGRCVTACPAGAIATPAMSAAGLRAVIAAMVDAARRPIGVAFTCSRRIDLVPRQGWYSVEVPCASMVPGTWPLAAVMLGARAATIVPCSQSGCSLGHDDVINQRVAFARAALGATGCDRDLVPVERGAVASDGSPLAAPLVDPFGIRGPHETMRALSALLGQQEIRLEHPAAPIGVVDIDPSACTMCGSCAAICPTHALHLGGDGDELTLAFDAALCTACDQCVQTCPEVAHGAIAVRRLVDSVALGAGAVTVNRAITSRCELCGSPVAPTPMLERLASLLGEEHSATMDYLSRRCTNCRGS